MAFPEKRIDPTANVHPDAYVAWGAYVGPRAVVMADAQVLRGAYVGEGAVVESCASVMNGAFVAPGRRVADSVTLHAGCTAFADVTRTPPEYAVVGEMPAGGWDEVARLYRAAWPEVPVVKNLDAKILSRLAAGGRLDMVDWHTCETAHCIAGWAVVCGGHKAIGLECLSTPSLVGGLIYRCSAGRWPNFFATNAEALADLHARAAGN